jgi:ParB-like chromosome segregation protein Spo0J
MSIRPDPDVLYDCGCDPDAPVCACLPLWASTTENEPMPRQPQDKLPMIQSLIAAHLDHPDLAVRVERLNELRRLISEHSPFKSEPVDFVEWVPKDDVGANSYNPNAVAPPEMELLRLSIMADGYTQPIVANVEDGAWVVVDGFHRNRVGKEMPDVTERVHGYLPVVQIRADRTDRGDRIASTIRHNRARGKHQVLAMSDIVLELRRRNWSDDKIGRELGMDADEVLRLYQITGLAEAFKDRDFSQAWEAVLDIEDADAETFEAIDG